MKILFVTSRLPYPPTKGDRLRAYHQLDYLHRRHDVSLFTLVQSRSELQYIPEVKKVCRDLRCYRLPAWRSILQTLFCAPFSRLPLQVLYFRSAVLRRMVQHAVDTEHFDVAHGLMARSAPCLIHLRNRPRVVFDIEDSYALNMLRRRDREGGLKRLLLHVEYRRMLRFEKSLPLEFDLCTAISETDRAFVVEPSTAAKVKIVANGVDLVHFSFADSPRDPDTVIFTGNMSYFPNRDAVLFFARTVLPLVAQHRPSVRFLIVGADPAPDVTALHDGRRIVVTGFVPDIHAYLTRAAVAVCPMLAGSGIQNKVLEAMASGIPVVASSKAVGGIRLRRGDECFVSDDPAEMAKQICALLTDPARASAMARRAIAFVRKDYSWERWCRELELCYEFVSGPSTSPPASTLA